jgi:5-methylcytosine-specific restriction endonuclease McrA
MFKRRYRSKKREAEALGSLIFVGIILGILSFIYHAAIEIGKTAFEFFKTTNGKISLAVIAIVTAGIIFRKIRSSLRKKEEWHQQQEIEKREYQMRQEAINPISPSVNREDYLIETQDYKRGNSKENYYRKTFALHLLETFDNCCAKCGDKENGVDIDHFIFSKNEGGCFIMRHKNGHLVNNAVPLCRTCNRSKSDDSYRSFYSEEELLSIFEKSMLMTKRLNDRPIFDEDGEIIKNKKAG